MVGLFTELLAAREYDWSHVNMGPDLKAKVVQWFWQSLQREPIG
jgi:hypothetical protein